MCSATTWLVKSVEDNRSDFGVHYGDTYGFKQEVTLQIQVEGSPAS